MQKKTSEKKMAQVVSPITRQVTKEKWEFGHNFVDIRLEGVEDCLIYDRRGVSFPFKNLYQDRKSIIIFVRVGKNFVWLNLSDGLLVNLPQVTFVES